MTTYLYPLNRDFSAGKVGDEVTSAEFEKVDSGFETVTGHPHLIDGATFGIGDHALQWEQSDPPSDCYVAWRVPTEYIYSRIFGRLYLNVSQLPDDIWTLLQIQKPDYSPIISLRVEDDGCMQWYSGDTGTDPIGNECSVKFPANKDVRIEYGIELSGSAPSGRAEARFFYRDLHSKKPDEVIVASGFRTAGAISCNRIRMGMFQMASETGSGIKITFDGLNANVDGFPGPYELLYQKFEMGDTLYPEFEPMWGNVGDPDKTFWTYLRGIGLMMQEVRDVSKDGLHGEPGWSQVLDATRVKPQWVPWLSQIAGYWAPVYNPADDEAAYLGRQIPRMKKFSSWNRGSIERLIAAVQEHLWGNQTVIVKERYDDDPNQMRIYFYESEIATSSEAAINAAIQQKAAGLLLGPEGEPAEPIILQPNTYNVLDASNADYNEVNTKHPTYNDVLTNTAE
jgi:hypothetical protein